MNSNAFDISSNNLHSVGVQKAAWMSTEITDIAKLSTMIRNCSSMTASSEVPDIKSVIQNFIHALDRREPPSVFQTVPVADACLNFTASSISQKTAI